MFQHAFDDIVGAPAVLADLFKIACQHVDGFVDLGALVISDCSNHRGSCLLQLVKQFDRQPGEVINEVQRVLDLMGDAGG